MLAPSSASHRMFERCIPPPPKVLKSLKKSFLPLSVLEFEQYITAPVSCLKEVAGFLTWGQCYKTFLGHNLRIFVIS
jgi:hypothetical protein